MSNDNPYFTYGGFFVPHRLLSSRKPPHGAKLLYALLASRADRRGVSLLNPELFAAEMGENEEGVLTLADELENANLLRLRRTNPKAFASISPASKLAFCEDER